MKKKQTTTSAAAARADLPTGGKGIANALSTRFCKMIILRLILQHLAPVRWSKQTAAHAVSIKANAASPNKQLFKGHKRHRLSTSLQKWYYFSVRDSCRTAVKFCRQAELARDTHNIIMNYYACPVVVRLVSARTKAAFCFMLLLKATRSRHFSGGVLALSLKMTRCKG